MESASSESLPRDWGIVPFVAVTGRPTEAAVRATVARVDAQGAGAFLVYARSGLEIEYMGEDWLRAVAWFCDEAARRGLRVWLYDEFNWPSGSCKGKVTEGHPEFINTTCAVYAKGDGSFDYQQIGSERHDYHRADWFAVPMKTNKGYWTEPYFDEAGGKTLMITYSQPIHDAQGHIVAVFGADVALDWLTKVLNEHHLYPSSYNLMVSRTGQLMACPTESLVMQKSIHEATANLTDTSVKNVNKQILEGQSGQATITDENGEKNYVFFAPIGRDSLLNNGEQLGWSMVVVCNDREIYKGLRQMGTAQLILMLVGLALLGYILSRTVKGFQKLQAVNIEKERVVRELTLARNIQMAMLPKAYNPSDDRFRPHGQRSE